MKTIGHHIYFGNNKDNYINNWAEETKTFIDVQDVELKIWDEESILELIKKHYKEKTLRAFLKIRPYAYKSDFARLLVLHTLGGWYADFGTVFLKKIDAKNFDLIIFYDHIAEAMYGFGAIQNSIIYSKKENLSLKYLIDALSEKILSEDYGKNPLDVTGPLRLFGLLQEKGWGPNKKELLCDCGRILIDLQNPKKIFLKETLEYKKITLDIFSGAPVTATSMYEINGERFAMYKDYEKNSTIKSFDTIESDYWQCWDNKIVYK
jgi:hypothetical protein